VQRMGITNCVVTNYDGRKFPKIMRGFDRVLLDAPCSCLGVLARYPQAKASRQYIDVYKAAHLQRELLRAAIDCCKVGGYVVYSTCSVAVEENEAVVDYVLKHRHCKIVETGLPEEIETKGYTKYKDRRYDDKMKMTRRVYPHRENMDGFYIAKLKKTKDGVKHYLEEEEAPVKKVKAETTTKREKGDGKNTKKKVVDEKKLAEKLAKKKTGKKDKKKGKKTTESNDEVALKKRSVDETNTEETEKPKKKVKTAETATPKTTEVKPVSDKLAGMTKEEKIAKIKALRAKKNA